MIIYEAELLEESKSLADWAVVGKTFSNEKIVSKQIYAWIPRWHLNAQGIAQIIARELNNATKAAEDDYRFLEN